ncbi:MAG: M10 family metallopeptidase [Burkholderiaceae bacterium]|nr:M10 family metallopeptidase [Burkholderiaceae bacterium]
MTRLDTSARLVFPSESIQSGEYADYLERTIRPVLGSNPGALLTGFRWYGRTDPATQRMVITYSFGERGTSPRQSTYAAPFLATLQEFTPADREATRAVLSHIESVAQIKFIEVPDAGSQSAMIRYAYSDLPNQMGFSGYSFYPMGDAGGDVWLGSAQRGPEWDGYRTALILHETLHALGLKHPFEGPEPLPSEENYMADTVMSYSPIPGTSTGSLSAYPDQPMPLDIEALHLLYGAARFNEGDVRYDLSDPRLLSGFEVIYSTDGTMGTDTMDASRAQHAVVLDLREGYASNIGAAVSAFGRITNEDGTYSWIYRSFEKTLIIADNSVIENAIGSSFDDFLTGNDFANALDGGPGNDILVGGRGNDILSGGAGVDVAMYVQTMKDMRLTRSGADWTITDIRGQEGQDTLIGIERVAFGDTVVALDLDGNAGKAARVLGAMLGPQFVHNKAAFGIALGLFDAGMTEAEVVGVAIEAALGPAPSHEVFVTSVYRNITGTPPPPNELGFYVDLLKMGAYSQGGLGMLAGQSDANAARIDLVGLAQTGIEYIPYAVPQPT